MSVFWVLELSFILEVLFIKELFIVLLSSVELFIVLLFMLLSIGVLFTAEFVSIMVLLMLLELSITELEELLNSASYSLPKTNHYDLIIRFCFINKIYRIIDVNDLLDEYNCELFDY